MNSAARETLAAGITAIGALIALAADKGADLLPSERKQLGGILEPADQQMEQLAALLEIGSQRAPARGKVIPRPAGPSPTVAEPSGVRDAALALRDVAMAIRDVAEAIREVGASARPAEPPAPAAPSPSPPQQSGAPRQLVKTGVVAKALGITTVALSGRLRRIPDFGIGSVVGGFRVANATTGTDGRRWWWWEAIEGEAA